MNTQANEMTEEKPHTPSDGQEVGVPVDRAPHGEGEMATEVTAESARVEHDTPPPALPWWISEKYHWERGASGNFYLKPFDEFLNYVIDKARKAADAGLGVCYPNGEHGKTQEAEIVAQAIEEVAHLRSSLTALSDLEGRSFDKFIVERCLRNAVYAATTQYELVNWASREAAKGNDVSTNDNYGEKASRKTTFMVTAGALFALIRETLPKADMSERAFQRMAKRVVYDNARMEADKLKTPAQATAEQKAGVEAATLVAEDF